MEKGSERSKWRKLLPVLAVILFMHLLTAGCWIVGKLAVEKGGMKPEVFAWFRYMISVPLLHLCLWFQTRKLPWEFYPAPEHMMKFAAWGCGHVYFGQYFTYVALGSCPAVMASVLQNTIPLFVFALALAMGVEQLIYVKYAACLKLAGLIMSVLGAATYTALKVLLNQKDDIHKYNYAKGVTFLLLHIVGSAYANVKMKQALNEGYDAMFATTWASTLGLALITALVGPHLSADDFRLSGKQVFLILFDSLVPSCLLQIATTWVVKQTSPTFASAFGPLTTAFAVPLAMLFLNEHPTPLAMSLGAPLIVLGLCLLVLGRHRESVLEDASARHRESVHRESVLC